jgi:hypothetical protein
MSSIAKKIKKRLKTFCGIIFRRETQRFRAKKANKRRCLIAKLSGGALSLLQPKPQVAAEIIILQKVYNFFCIEIKLRAI